MRDNWTLSSEPNKKKVCDNTDQPINGEDITQVPQEIVDFLPNRSF